MYASMIGAVYVYFLSGDPAFAMASAFSPVLFGLLGGGSTRIFKGGSEIPGSLLFGMFCGNL